MRDIEAIGLLLGLVASGGLATLAVLWYILARQPLLKDWWKHGAEMSPSDGRKKS